jgi:hypothetical protein
MDNRRRPIGGAAGKAVFGCFAVVIDGTVAMAEISTGPYCAGKSECFGILALMKSLPSARCRRSSD